MNHISQQDQCCSAVVKAFHESVFTEDREQVVNLRMQVTDNDGGDVFTQLQQATRVTQGILESAVLVPEELIDLD